MIAQPIDASRGRCSLKNKHFSQAQTEIRFCLEHRVSGLLLSHPYVLCGTWCSSVGTPGLRVAWTCSTGVWCRPRSWWGNGRGWGWTRGPCGGWGLSSPPMMGARLAPWSRPCMSHILALQSITCYNYSLCISLCKQPNHHASLLLN